MVTNTMIGIQVNYQPACFGPTVLACLLIDILWNPPVLRNLSIWSRRYYVHHIFYSDRIRNYDVLIAGRLCLDINGCSILYKRWAVAWKIFLTLQLTSGHCFPGKQAKAGKEQAKSRWRAENRLKTWATRPPLPKSELLPVETEPQIFRRPGCWLFADGSLGGNWHH